MTDTIFATCPHCKQSLRVVIGRKSTVKRVRCRCGIAYEYSAWKLRHPRADEPTVSLRTFYQVDLFKV